MSSPPVTDAMNASIPRPFAILIIWATLAYSIGIYLFLNGFLLTRQTLHIENAQPLSPWTQFPVVTNHSNADLLELNVSEMLLPKTIPFIHDPPFRRAIIVVIDALRFDFLPKLSPRETDQFFTNRLPVVQELLDDMPESTILFQFRADPPTTTMQRLKALMTGSLPTFIDAGSNFASSEISEDHLLKHITRRFHNTYFMGDDTWTHLFSDVLNDTTRTFAFDSFKVFDLDTVDHGILGKLWPLLADGHLSDHVNIAEADSKTSSQWDCIITHFLGVDHCGHTYGPFHPTLASKLDEMNMMLSHLVQNVDKDTLLVVLGDHGMSKEGDHGGESEEEVMSGLLLHSKRRLTMQPSSDLATNVDNDYYRQLFSRMHRNREKTLSYDHEAIAERLGYDATAYPIVSQIHLVPTLSYLFGIPIPFGNLGSLIPDLVVPQAQEDGPANLLYLIQQFRINALQVYNYLNLYSSSGKHNGFSTTALDPLFEILYSADAEFAELLSQPTFSNWKINASISDHDAYDLMSRLENILMLYDKFLTATLKYCKTIWAQFDVGCMVAGCVVLCIAFISCLVLYLKPSRIEFLRYAFNNTNVRISTILSALIGLTAGIIVAYLSSSESGPWYLYAGKYGLFDKMTILGWTTTIAILGNIIGVVVLAISQHVLGNHTFNCIKDGVASISHSHDIYLVLATGFVHALTLGSNSYIVYEDTVVRFILASWCIYWLISGVATSRHTLTSARTSADLWFPVILLLFVQVSSSTGLCREEQQPHCSYIHSGSLTFLARDTESQTILAKVTQKWLPAIATSGFLLLATALSSYLPRQLKSTWSSISGLRNLPLRTYAWYNVLYSTTIWTIIMRYIYLICENTSSTQSVVNSVIQSSVYRVLTTRIIGKDVSSAQNLRIITRIFQLYIPRFAYTVGGLFILLAICTAWKSKPLQVLKQSTWIALIGTTIILATIQRPIGGMIILCWPLILQLLTRASATSNISQTLLARLVILHYLGEHLFFVTGHQAILTAIHWESAYIGFEEMHLIPNAILVSLATLGGFIISWSSSMIIVCEVLSEIQDREVQKFAYETSLLLICLFNFIPTSFSSIFIIILRRHLMTWKIFAPRFLLQCILCMGSCLYVIGVDSMVGHIMSEPTTHRF
ncbi:mannose-ethanolamine phosphotransferase gpi13 [Umbelopsis nana]